MEADTDGRVVPGGAEPGAAVPGSGGLLERERELEAIDRAVDRAAAGAAGLVVIEGPPGIGKTALMSSARARARERDMTVLFARGSELERGFAFGAVRRLFEAVLCGAGARERGLLLAGAAGLAAPLLGLGSPSAKVESSDSDPTFALQHGLYWLAVNLADRAPVLIAVDDLHWVDVASQRWLMYLANRLEDLPILVLATTRPDDRAEDAEVSERLSAHPAVQLVVPSALSRDAVGVLASRAFGDQAGDALASACHRATAGNPHLLGELVASLRADGGATGDAGMAARIDELVPEAVARSTLVRLARLGPLAGPVARAVAVLGSGPELRDVAGVTGLSPTDAAQSLDVLGAADILTSEHPLDFAHPIVRSAVYADIPMSERAMAHRRAASLLYERDAPAEQVAAHLLVAEPVREAWATGRLRRAAGDASARGAQEAAVAYLQRAVQAAPPRERAEILLQLGAAQVHLDPAVAVENLRAAQALTAKSRQRAQIARDLSMALILSMRPSEALAELDQAADDVAGEDPQLSLLLEADRFGMAQLDPASAVAAATRLKRVAGLADPDTDSEGGRLLLACLAHQAAMEGSGAADTAAQAERALGGMSLAVTPALVRTVYTLLLADRIVPVRELLDRVLADTVARGEVAAFILARAMRSRLELWTGDVARAEIEARIAAEAARPMPGAWAARVLIHVLVVKGETEEAEAELRSSGLTGDVPDMFLFNALLYARGRLRLACHELEDGVADLLELGRRLERSGITNSVLYPWRAAAAGALARLGRFEPARAIAAEDLRSARRWGTPRALGIALRGHALSQTGRPSLAELQASVSELERCPAQLELAESLLELGAALRRDNRRSDSRAPLRRSLEIATRCPAPALAERARQELQATGARPRRTQLTGRDSLTASERHVAELAGQGLTNPQIAQSLFVTRKTIEMHLGRVYRKLGLSSRDQLADALAPSTPG